MGKRQAKTTDIVIPWAQMRVLVEESLDLVTVTAPGVPLELGLEEVPTKGFESELMLAADMSTSNWLVSSCIVSTAEGLGSSRAGPDFQAAIQPVEPVKSMPVHLLHLTLATMLPSTTPEPLKSVTSLLAS